MMMMIYNFLFFMSELEPGIGPAAIMLRSSDSPKTVLKRIARDKSVHLAAAFQWASAAADARVYVACEASPDSIEEWFATPLASPQQVQRLLDAPGKCLILPDGHKTLATVEPR